MTQQSLIEFPAEIAVKAMGLDENDFCALVAELVQVHIEPQAAKFTTKPSKRGKYLSVSVHFTALSLEQLHAVYGALKQEPRVLFTL